MRYYVHVGTVAVLCISEHIFKRASENSTLAPDYGTRKVERECCYSELDRISDTTINKAKLNPDYLYFRLPRSYAHEDGFAIDTIAVLKSDIEWRDMA